MAASIGEIMLSGAVAHHQHQISAAKIGCGALSRASRRPVNIAMSRAIKHRAQGNNQAAQYFGSNEVARNYGAVSGETSSMALQSIDIMMLAPDNPSISESVATAVRGTLKLKLPRLPPGSIAGKLAPSALRPSVLPEAALPTKRFDSCMTISARLTGAASGGRGALGTEHWPVAMSSHQPPGDNKLSARRGR